MRNLTHHLPVHDDENDDEGWIALNEAAQRMRVCRETMRSYLIRGSFTSRRNALAKNRWEVRAAEIEAALRGRPDIGYVRLELVPDAELEEQELSA